MLSAFKQYGLLLYNMTKKTTGADEDLHLSIAIKQGDKKAFGRLYDKYAPVLMGLISRVLPDDSDREEMLQTAFLHIWDQIGSFDALGSSFLTWLINITRHLAINKAKSLTAQYQPNQNPVYLHSNKNNENQLFSVSVQKVIFDLVYYKGLTCTEAAAALTMPVEEIKKNIRLAIKSINGEIVV